MRYISLLGYIIVCLTEGSTSPREKRNGCSPFNVCDFDPPCKNSGTCRRDENTCVYSCHCGPDFTGEECETRLESDSNVTCDIDECLTGNPCYNGGTCVVDNSTCACQCTSNYTGDNCTEPVSDPNSSHCLDFCAGISCKNGGTCRQNDQCHTYCDCPEEFTGDECQHTVTSQATGSTPTSTSLRPFTERTCDKGFTCLHGQCHLWEDGSVQCNCDPGFIGIFCHIPCDLECGENGACDRLNYTAPLKCQCKYPYTGSTCQDIIVKPSVDEWRYWILGCSLVLLLILGGFCILIYILLKKRNIFIMRIKYYFQPFEDDDGKEFDAFISYKSAPEDEAFVYRTIYPELEVKRGYKLCLHQRDFRVGETIANNILWAIANSRRTILVLSPQYMESDFTRFEYQEAHAEMLKMQHKVIPVLLDDVSQQKHLMDRTLTSILKSITYIEWPKEGSEESLKKFWRRLELSLPKKRPDSVASSPSSAYPVLSFSNSSFDSQLMDVDVISFEYNEQGNNDDSISDEKGNHKKEPKFDNDIDKIMLESDKKENGEYSLDLKGTNLTERELKAFFKEPIDEERFQQMRGKASEYEDCLSTNL